MKRAALAEILLIFAVFFVQGAWPVPDVNEPYYLGKAIHFWNHDWLRGDFFMESDDAHQVFDLTFGWLSLFLSPVGLAWTGRVLTWFLLAWAWRRLSFAVVPRAWWSVLSAALFVGLMDRCQMAGEWVIGGVEAKGIAYVLVLLGLGWLVRNGWNRALLLFGAAAAFHVLVGGWAAVAAGLGWLRLRFAAGRLRGAGVPPAIFRAGATPAPRNIPLPYVGIIGGLLLSLPGLLPSLMLDWGTDAQTVQKARQFYVFERLPHHLVLSGIRPDFILRMALLGGFWAILSRFSRNAVAHGNVPAEERSDRPQEAAICRLRAFVLGAVVIGLAGVAIQPLVWLDRAAAAELLRFYWFRLADVALPLGVALEGVAVLSAWRAAAVRHPSEADLAGGEGRRQRARPPNRPAPPSTGPSAPLGIGVGDSRVGRLFGRSRVGPDLPRSAAVEPLGGFWRLVCGVPVGRPLGQGPRQRPISRAAVGADVFLVHRAQRRGRLERRAAGRARTFRVVAADHGDFFHRPAAARTMVQIVGRAGRAAAAATWGQVPGPICDYRARAAAAPRRCLFQSDVRHLSPLKRVP